MRRESCHPEDTTDARVPLTILDVLRRSRGSVGAPDTLPEAHADEGRKGEEDAQRDTQSPDRLDFVTMRLVSRDESQVAVVSGGSRRVATAGDVANECLRRRRGGLRKQLTLEHRERLTNRDGDDDECYKEGEVESTSNQKREHAIIVKNVRDGHIERGDRGLILCELSVKHEEAVQARMENVPL